MTQTDTPAPWEEEFEKEFCENFYDGTACAERLILNFNADIRQLKNFISKQIAEAEKRGYQRCLIETGRAHFITGINVPEGITTSGYYPVTLNLNTKNQ